jgi:hypothetical protein
MTYSRANKTPSSTFLNQIKSLGPLCVQVGPAIWSVGPYTRRKVEYKDRKVTSAAISQPILTIFAHLVVLPKDQRSNMRIFTSISRGAFVLQKPENCTFP